MGPGDVVECVKPNGFGGILPGELGVVVSEPTPGNYCVYWGLREGYHWHPAHYRSSGWYESANNLYQGMIREVPPLLLLALAATEKLPVLPDYIVLETAEGDNG